MADYGININVQVRDAAVKRLKSELKELKALSASAGKNLEELASNKALTNQKTLEKRFRTVRRAVENYTRAIINGDAALKASSQNLRRQAQILKQFGTQIDATSRQSKGFFANIQQAAVNLNLKATMQDLRALKQEAQGTAEALKGGRGGFVFKGAGTQDLLQFVPARTIDSLTDYSRVLGDVMRQADMGSDIYRELERRIRAVNAEMAAAGRIVRPQSNAYGAPIGPALPPGLGGRMLPTAGAAFRGNNRARDVLTGAGFPLLFGGGPAQALAGGIGGAVGGLGGSIAASAIVSQIEAFGQAIAKVGQSLNPLTFDLQTFASAAGISGTEVEEFLATIEKYGGKAQAAAEASKILAMRIGTDARDALQKFGSDAQKLGNQLNTIFTTVMANIARIVGPLLSQLANALERGNLVRGFKEREGLTGRAAVAQQILEVQGRRAGKGAKGADIKRLGAQIGLTGTTSEILEAAKGIGVESQRTFESQQFASLGQTAAALEAADKDKGSKGKLESSLRRTEALKEQAKTLLKTALIQDKINNAERIGAKDLAMRLTFERDRAEIFGRYNADVAKVKDTANKQAEIDALTEKRNSQLFALSLDYEAKRAAFDLQKKEAGFEQLTQLQQEAYVLEQTLQGKGEEAALEVAIANAIKNIKNPAIAATVAQRMRENFETQKAIAIAEQMKQVYADIGMTIKTGVVDAIAAAVEGTKTLGEVASNMLRDIGMRVLDMAVNMALFGVASGVGKKDSGGLLSSIFGRADGGSVSSGRPYMVGERGPELFVPGAQGNIVPNHSMGSSNIVVNVDASGSSVEGSADQANQLGKAIGVAVQQELIKQKRPGGLLAGT